jgi:hypothetical protein
MGGWGTGAMRCAGGTCWQHISAPCDLQGVSWDILKPETA